MNMTRSERERLWRLAETYRTAQDRTREELLAHAQSLVDADVPAAQVAKVAGMSRQQLHHLLRDRRVRQEAPPE